MTIVALDGTVVLSAIHADRHRRRVRGQRPGWAVVRDSRVAQDVERANFLVYAKAMCKIAATSRLPTRRGARTADPRSLRSGRDRRMPAPKEQPPRNLSGKRTTAQQNLERVRESRGDRLWAVRAADGITLSGNATDGALENVHHAFSELTHVANNDEFQAHC
jgi:hypothetical protein